MILTKEKLQTDLANYKAGLDSINKEIARLTRDGHATAGAIQYIEAQIAAIDAEEKPTSGS